MVLRSDDAYKEGCNAACLLVIESAFGSGEKEKKITLLFRLAATRSILQTCR